MTLTFARFDFLSWALQRQPLLPLLLVAALGFIMPIPGFAIVAAALVASMTASLPFLGDERGRLDTLYGILPVSRRSVVVGRALSLLAYYAVAAASATLVTYIAAATRGVPVPLDDVLIAHAAGIAIVGLPLALQLPVLFRVGYSRGRLISYAPALMLAGAGWVAQAVGATEIAVPTDGPLLPILGVAGVLAGVLGVAIGTTVATATYGRRSL